MELLCSQHEHVLACDSDAFIGDTPANLTHYLEVALASQVQNWLYARMETVHPVQHSVCQGFIL
jgi:hypothetical protein